MQTYFQKILIALYKLPHRTMAMIIIGLTINAVALALFIYFRLASPAPTPLVSDPAQSSTLYADLLSTIAHPPTTGAFFGSSGGSYYYPKSCARSSKIKEKNRVWFATEDQSISSGYQKNPTCR